LTHGSGSGLSGGHGAGVSGIQTSYGPPGHK
jgi:hypothetical protein